MSIQNKTCCTCKIVFPKTHEYFFKKVIKQKLVNGDIATYQSFRHNCKKCHALKTKQSKNISICKENGWDIKEYKKEWKKKYSFGRLKYKELKDVPKGIRARIISKMDKGYKFTTISDFKIFGRENQGMAKRKYKYNHNGLLTCKDKNEMYRGVLLDCVIANKMKRKLGEIPVNLLETQRLIIKLNREINK